MRAGAPRLLQGGCVSGPAPVVVALVDTAAGEDFLELVRVSCEWDVRLNPIQYCVKDSEGWASPRLARGGALAVGLQLPRRRGPVVAAAWERVRAATARPVCAPLPPGIPSPAASPVPPVWTCPEPVGCSQPRCLFNLSTRLADSPSGPCSRSPAPQRSGAALRPLWRRSRP
jgi:hypothetical protein